MSRKNKNRKPRVKSLHVAAIWRLQEQDLAQHQNTALFEDDGYDPMDPNGVEEV